MFSVISNAVGVFQSMQIGYIYIYKTKNTPYMYKGILPHCRDEVGVFTAQANRIYLVLTVYKN